MSLSDKVFTWIYYQNWLFSWSLKNIFVFESFLAFLKVFETVGKLFSIELLITLNVQELRFSNVIEQNNA